MAKIITITTPKGGVGKTTIAYYLADMYRQKGNVLVIDTDSQGNLTRFLLGGKELDDSNNFVRMFEGKKPSPVKINENLSLIGSNIKLAKYDSKSELNNFFLLSKYLKINQDKYDYVIIDTPPNLGMFTLNALLVTEYVVTVLDPSIDALEAQVILEEVMNDVRADHNEKIKLVGMILNTFDSRNKNDKDIYSMTKEKYPDSFIETVITRTTKVRDCRAEYKSILEAYPDNKVSVALQKIFKDINKRIGV